MAQDSMDTIPNAMNCIDDVCLKALPCLAMLKSIRVDSAVKISAFKDVPDRSQILIWFHSDTRDMLILTGCLQVYHEWGNGGLHHEDHSRQFR